MRKQEFDDKLLLTLPPIPIFINKCKGNVLIPREALKRAIDGFGENTFE